MNQLSDLIMAGDQKRYPDKHEMADYLEFYAQHNKLPVLLNKNVYSVEYNDQIYSLKTQDGETFQAKCLVNVTGANQKVNVLDISRDIPVEIQQLTIDQYQNRKQLSSKNIAIIGDGASGCQVAKELAETHNVTLFCVSPRPFAPQELFGINTLALFKKNVYFKF